MFIVYELRTIIQNILLFHERWKNIVDQEFLTPSQTKRINAIMLTCGFYNDVGGFVFNVGLPAKSGVGGGIVAVYPGK